jgi:diguanylate cyclase (GGDEF)-like protein
MRGVLYPAVALMNRLTYVKKFILIGVLVMLPVLLTVNLLIAGIDKQIEATEKERRGVEYNVAVRDLMELLQQHRGMLNAYLNGSEHFGEQLDKQRQLILVAMEHVDQVNSLLGAEFATNELWEEIQSDWNSFLGRSLNLGPQAGFAIHTDLIDKLLHLFTHVADVSGLKLDPGQDSYLFMSVLTEKLPLVIETTGQIRGMGTGVAVNGRLDVEENLRLITLTGTLESALIDLGRYSERTENEMLQEQLQPVQTQHQELTYSYISIVRHELLYANSIDVDPELLFAKGTEGIQAGFALYDAMVPLLHELLTERVESLQQQKQMVSALAIAATLVILYLFGAFYESMTRTILTLKEASLRFAAGELSTRVRLHTKDELQEVGSFFNQMADSFSQMMQDRKQYEEQIVYQAHYDPLTSLPNRTLLADRLAVAITDAQRRGHTLAVIFLDLDRFKLINDTLGHDVGDALLVRVAERLVACVRKEDTVCRMGGDEFLFVLPNIGGIDYVKETAERISGVLAEPVQIDQHKLYISGSIGISMYPSDGANSGELIKNADTAMYAAKNQGRGCYRFYDRQMNEKAGQMLQIETNLRRALEREEFTLYYQPKLDLVSGVICGVEALVRWNHPTLGLVPPSDFIPVAEELGLIIPLGEWVLRTACIQNKAWQDAGLAPLRISVNITSAQFQREDFYHTVASALEDSGLEAGWLELELTESVVMNISAKASIRLKQLKELGICLAIDDFGTGFSSLSYLKHFPIDTLKIDRSFIKDIPGAPKDTAITKTIIALGRRLGLRVVAEGVETKEQLAFLASRKCNEVQGYLLSKPLPAHEFVLFLERQASIEDVLGGKS